MIDLINISTHTSNYNFHSHTQYCDGRDTMEHFVQRAIEQGYEHLGFTPHAPIMVESPCNMGWSAVPEYLGEVERLKDKYGDKINLYASMEIDYIDSQFNSANEYFQSLPLDYRLSSVHFIPDKHGNYTDVDGKFDTFRQRMSDCFDDDIRYVVDTFYAQSMQMVKTGGFDIVGHLDKIGQNAAYFRHGIEHEKWYEQHVYALLEEIKMHGYIVEINTKALNEHHRTFPHYRYYKYLKQNNIPVLFNSDVHYTHLIGAGRAEAQHTYDLI